MFHKFAANFVGDDLRGRAVKFRLHNEFAHAVFLNALDELFEFARTGRLSFRFDRQLR